MGTVATLGPTLGAPIDALGARAPEGETDGVTDVDGGAVGLVVAVGATGEHPARSTTRPVPATRTRVGRSARGLPTG